MKYDLNECKIWVEFNIARSETGQMFNNKKKPRAFF